MNASGVMYNSLITQGMGCSHLATQGFMPFVAGQYLLPDPTSATWVSPWEEAFPLLEGEALVLEPVGIVAVSPWESDPDAGVGEYLTLEAAGPTPVSPWAPGVPAIAGQFLTSDPGAAIFSPWRYTPRGGCSTVPLKVP